MDSNDSDEYDASIIGLGWVEVVTRTHATKNLVIQIVLCHFSCPQLLLAWSGCTFLLLFSDLPSTSHFPTLI